MTGLEPSAPPPPDSVVGTVARVLFSSDEDGWCAIRCRREDGEHFTAVGPLLGIREGDRVRFTGRWVKHPKFGRQLETGVWVHDHPTTISGLRRFLGSGRIRGLGPTIANRVVDAFGLETLDVIEHRPERLREVPGIGRKRARQIVASWKEHTGLQQVMVFLTGHGVTPGVAAKVYRRYKGRALEVVRETPYRLADEIDGIGFLRADGVARSLGVAVDDPAREEAGTLYALREAAGEGHVFLPLDELGRRATALLELDRLDVGAIVERLRDQGRARTRRAVSGETAVYLPVLERAEETVARCLARLLTAPSSSPPIDRRRAMAWFERQSGLELAAEQRAALNAALSARVVVVTGGPGTGKTTLIRGVTQILGRKEQRVLLAAPTGRAAKRLAEATGVAAKTIHRLLEFSPATRSFTRDADRPLAADLLVVDEASMLDVELAAHLVRAIPLGCRLVLVGDADQLPSVGPGNVLADLIASDAIPVVRLRTIFRQAAESLIVVNAHRINHGEMPILAGGDVVHDFYFVSRDDPAEAASTAVDLVARRIPRRFGCDPTDDIQLLAPMHRGELGVTSLNQRLRAALNPEGPELVIGARTFRVGDKAMQVRNNYELDVFNGDIGRVVDVDSEQRRLVVRFDDRPVVLDGTDLDDLVPAYAVTIHKSQGSEYPMVVVVLHHQHYIMLERNLLYTAVTRGRRLVVVVGSRRALRRAVANATVRRRFTLLAERLQRRRR